MLTLNCRNGESIILTLDGKTTKIHLHSLKDNQDRLAFDAQDDVKISCN